MVVITQLLICIFYSTLTTGIFNEYSYDTYTLVVRCMKQNKDAVWSLLLLVTGLRADPQNSYSYDILCMYVRIVAFDFSSNISCF